MIYYILTYYFSDNGNVPALYDTLRKDITTLDSNIPIMVYAVTNYGLRRNSTDSFLTLKAILK